MNEIKISFQQVVKLTGITLLSSVILFTMFTTAYCVISGNMPQRPQWFGTFSVIVGFVEWIAVAQLIIVGIIDQSITRSKAVAGYIKRLWVSNPSITIRKRKILPKAELK